MQRIISFIDIKRLDDTGKIDKLLSERYDEELVDRVLYNMGFSPHHPINQELILHRPATATNKEPVLGWCFVGVERSDNKWLKSGYCSRETELKVIANKDKSFAEELERMSRVVCHTQTYLDSLAG